MQPSCMRVIWHYMIVVYIEDARPYACHCAARIAGTSQMSNVEYLTRSRGVITRAMASSLYREQHAFRKTNEECQGDSPQAQP